MAVLKEAGMDEILGIYMPALSNRFTVNIIEVATKQYHQMIPVQVVRYNYDMKEKKLVVTIEIDSGARVLNEINQIIGNIKNLAIVVDLMDGHVGVTGRIMFEALSIDSASFGHDYAECGVVSVDLTLSVGMLSFASPDRKIVPLYSKDR